jgi:hypothetical protein
LIAGRSSEFVLKYELSPINVVYTHQQKATFDFIVELCAIIGGFFTVFSIVESMVEKVTGYFSSQLKSP